VKILHYSDKHSPNFSSLYAECDLLFSTGDLTLFDFPGLEQINIKKPSFGVYGNHDSGTYLEELGIINLHNKVVEWNGLTLGGFQGCLKYKNAPLMFVEEEAKEFADNFPYVDILLLHAGPKDILDDPSDDVHIGSENIKRYVLDKKPKYIFCGHQYSDDFLDLGETKVYRTYGARLVEANLVY
jgi:uncharacterized protein